jgi:hypothetical protein
MVVFAPTFNTANGPESTKCHFTHKDTNNDHKKEATIASHHHHHKQVTDE